MSNKLIDEIIERIIGKIESEHEDIKKLHEFSFVWDTIRDQYEQKFGRDELYYRMWLMSSMVQKDFREKMQRFPASKEFITKTKYYVQEIMGNEYNEEQFKNFFYILYWNLLDSKEFCSKVIEVRKDIDQYLMIKGIYSHPFYERINNYIGDSILTLDDSGVSSNADIYYQNDKIIDLYADNFSQVMFMQKENEVQVTLEDLYVENEYEIILGEKNSLGLFDYIINFSKTTDGGPILIMEGHAGIGKSSLISKLAFEYKNNVNWNGRKLAIIQLRNLVSDNCIDVFNPWSDFMQYLDFKGSMREFMDVMNNTLLLLDGFDELCLVENIKLSNKLIYVSNIVKYLETYSCECRVIVTTRPNYLARRKEWYLLCQSPTVLSLKHFSSNKRIEWINKARIANMKIDKSVEKSVIASKDNDIEVVASTPLTLYLIVHERIVVSKNDELWSVYQKIFGKEIMRKRYDQLGPNRDNFIHPAEVIANTIYEVTKEIAYCMFQNSKMDVLWDEIEKCIEKVTGNTDSYNTDTILRIENIRDLLKDSYALFNYYKETDLGGGVSFYHNYIREFFVQEKIYEEFEVLYEDMLNKKIKGILDVSNEMNSKLSLLLSNSKLSDKTIDFLGSHGRVYINNKYNWMNLENQFCWLRSITTDMLMNDEVKKYNENYIINLWLVFESIRDQFRDVTEENFDQIFEESRIEQISKNNSLMEYLEIVSKYCDIKNIDFKNVNWRGKTLKNVNFFGCNFEFADMSGMTMENVQFAYCKMKDITMNGTDIKKTEFMHSDLNLSKLKGSQITGCVFTSCDMVCNLNGARLINTKFCESSIEKAELYGTEFVHSSISDTVKIINNALSFKFAIMDKFDWGEGNEKIKDEFVRKKNIIEVNNATVSEREDINIK